MSTDRLFPGYVAISLDCLGRFGYIFGQRQASGELAGFRESARRRITGRAEMLRRKTGEELKRDVVRVKRAQSSFAKELRKVGVVK